MKNNTYAVASIFLLSLPLSANPISWGEKSTNLNLTEHLEYYIDSDNNATLAAIEKVDDKNFRPAAGANLGFSAKPIWLRFRFAQNGEKILLRHDYAMTDYLTLYSPTTQGYIATDTGDMRPFASRAVKNRLMSFWVTPVKERWYYMRLQTGGSVNFAFTLLTPTEALESDNISQYFLGIFFGTIFVMFFYNLFLYLSLREASYIFYCLYIVAFAFMAATLNGLAFQLVWPQSPWWQNHAFPFFAGVGMTMGVIFALLFLQLRKLNRILYWVAMAVASVGSIAIVLTFVIDPAISVRLVNGLGVFWVLTILSSAVFAFAKGYKPARYFLLAWLAMLVGTTIFILTSRGLLPPNPFLLNAMFVGSALEVILLSLALADRINQFKKEKERLQQLALDKQKVLTDSYSRFFPRRMLELLDRKSVEEISLGDATERHMTVLFADIRGFTTLSESMSPQDSFRFLNSYLKRVGPIIRANDGFIDKFMGDGIMALFPENVEAALKSAITMEQTVRKYNHHRMKSGYDPIRIGIGIHTGALMLGTVGEKERMDGTVISDAVNLASRIESLTKKFDANVLISEMVFQALSDPTQYLTRVIARVRVKGKNVPVTVLQVFDGMPDYAIEMLNRTRGDFERGFLYFHEKRFVEAAQCFVRVIDANPSDNVARMYLDKANFFERIGAVSVA